MKKEQKPLGTPVTEVPGVGWVPTAAAPRYIPLGATLRDLQHDPNVDNAMPVRNLVMQILEQELCTEESTDLVIGVSTAMLPVGLRQVARFTLDRLLPEYLLRGIRALLRLPPK